MTLADETRERREYLDFSSAIVKIHYSIFTNKNQHYVVNITDSLDKKFALVAGSSAQEYLLDHYPSIKLLPVENTLKGLNKVISNQAYGFIGSLATARLIIQETPSLLLKFSDQILFESDLKVATRQDEPLLKGLFQKSINFLKEQQKQQIYNKWIAIKYKKSFDYSLVYQLLVIILIFILYREFSLRFYNKKLKKEITK
jgi:polar amino acid transport system substrate-binding protein